MDRHSVRIRATSWGSLVWAIALLIISGCAPIVAVVAPPQVPDGVTGVMPDVLPDDIALTRSDMPAGFQLAAEKRSGPEYVALYLRPSALDGEASGGNMLLSVMTSIGVYTTTAEAEQVYLKASADSTQQASEDVALVNQGATDVVIAPFSGAVRGADASEAHRVTYRLMGQTIFEYGHRFRLGNVIAYVVVAAIGNPDEPAHLLRDARDLVQRQINHIAETAALSTSGNGD